MTQFKPTLFMDYSPQTCIQALDSPYKSLNSAPYPASNITHLLVAQRMQVETKKELMVT
jgi:hypothetical protein